MNHKQLTVVKYLGKTERYHFNINQFRKYIILIEPILLGREYILGMRGNDWFWKR